MKRAWPWVTSTLVTIIWAYAVLVTAFIWETRAVLNPRVSQDMTITAGGFTGSTLLAALITSALGAVVAVFVSLALYFLYGRRRRPVFYAALAGPLLVYTVYLVLSVYDRVTSSPSEVSVSWNLLAIAGTTAIYLLPSVAAVGAVGFMSSGDVAAPTVAANERSA